MKYQIFFLGIVGVVLLISGCIATNGGSPTPVPTQEQVTITPTATPVPTATVTVVATPTPTPTPAPNVTYPQYLSGFIVDDLGNGVPGVNVTLWQNGQLMNYTGNPQESGDGLIAPLGAYSFVTRQDTLQPGVYQIMAQNDGFIGSITVNYQGMTVNKNISLLGYVYIPQATPMPNVTYPLYLTGLVLDCNGISVPGANVTLWQNGQVISCPENPQQSSDGQTSAPGTYNFTVDRDNLSIGDYQITAEKYGQPGSITVNYPGGNVSWIRCNVSIPSYAYVSL